MNTNYLVYWVSPDDNQPYLLGGANTIHNAEEIAINQMIEVWTSPFMKTKEKLAFMKSTYIYDKLGDCKIATQNMSKLIEAKLYL